ncbi:MAG: hypothetical protein KGJ60_11815 [Verrucomicrobiota bacterium]|nr:hypothetical protein [Verrucomicrobiota bacterium]MDE3068224.1 hypothetical protein [Verrucomicrobiota bacterium]
MTRDKQLRGIKLKEVFQKQRLGQALNVKEFAALAGLSYSTARGWFRAKGFPAFNGKVFWQDFVIWRRRQTGIEPSAGASLAAENPPSSLKHPDSQLPPKAQKLLSEA